jgi:hypothetical protein
MHHKTWDFLGLLSTCLLLFWLPITLDALVSAKWFVPFCFFGFHCSATLSCHARAGNAVVPMTCSEILSAPMGSLLAMGSLNTLGGKSVDPSLMIVLNEMGDSPGIVQCNHKKFHSALTGTEHLG